MNDINKIMDAIENYLDNKNINNKDRYFILKSMSDNYFDMVISDDEDEDDFDEIEEIEKPKRNGQILKKPKIKVKGVKNESHAEDNNEASE